MANTLGTSFAIVRMRSRKVAGCVADSGPKESRYSVYTPLSVSGIPL
jgi:hypothetical protein